ncbi:hypothetical protein Dda_3849 [Drechslerella dactyloides]|uniref:Uncharacterized protein n=1 Tax=Drechslerella dactyloides TaxID=74499 RepID=A0AAD6J309_DREDA|nr:hypothetical protein Dda_3849 [Drechslerella dactyloides]
MSKHSLDPDSGSESMETSLAKLRKLEGDDPNFTEKVEREIDTSGDHIPGPRAISRRYSEHFQDYKLIVTALFGLEESDIFRYEMLISYTLAYFSVCARKGPRGMIDGNVTVESLQERQKALEAFFQRRVPGWYTISTGWQSSVGDHIQYLAQTFNLLGKKQRKNYFGLDELGILFNHTLSKTSSIPIFKQSIILWQLALASGVRASSIGATDEHPEDYLRWKDVAFECGFVEFDADRDDSNEGDFDEDDRERIKNWLVVKINFRYPREQYDTYRPSRRETDSLRVRFREFKRAKNIVADPTITLAILAIERGYLKLNSYQEIPEYLVSQARRLPEYLKYSGTFGIPVNNAMDEKPVFLAEIPGTDTLSDQPMKATMMHIPLQTVAAEVGFGHKRSTLSSFKRETITHFEPDWIPIDENRTANKPAKYKDQLRSLETAEKIATEALADPTTNIFTNLDTTPDFKAFEEYWQDILEEEGTYPLVHVERPVDKSQRNAVTALPQFLSLDIGENFNINAPGFQALPVPSAGGPPDVENATLWYDQVRNRILLYGGSFQNTTGDVDTTPQAIWSYDIVQEQWSAVTTMGDTVTRAASGASTFVDDVGYYRGGQQDAYTTPDYPEPSGYTLLSGLRTFNMTSREFGEVTSGFEVFGDPIQNGYKQGTLVPIELAGRKYLVNYGGGGKTGVGLPLKNIYVYDIQEQTWYIQPVDGDAPPNARGVCAVAAYASDRSSVNIYNYGGITYDNNAQRFTQSRGIWILSIPAFKWIFVDKGDNLQPGGIQDHTCHLQGTNMLLIGGRDFSSSCDANPVKVFNVSTLKWQSEFSTSPSEYQVPYEVFSKIGGNSSGFSTWSNKPLQDPPDANSPLFSIRGTGLPSATPTSDAAPSNDSRHRDAVIAGTTIGAIAFVSLVVGLALLLRNRKGRQGQEKNQARNFHNQVFDGIATTPAPSSPSNTDLDGITITPRSPESTRKFWGNFRRAPSSAMPHIPRRPTERRREQLSMLDTNIDTSTTIGQLAPPPPPSSDAGSEAVCSYRGNSMIKENPNDVYVSPVHADARERAMEQIYPGLAELPAESMSSDEGLPHLEEESRDDGVVAELEPRPQERASARASIRSGTQIE